MKKTSHVIALLLLICFFASCTVKKSNDPNQRNFNNSNPLETSEDFNGGQIDEQPDEQSNKSSAIHSSFDAKELSRDGDYKLMEMYVYDDNVELSRRITFELPIEWHSDSSSVVGLPKGNDIYPYILKVDMWNVKSATKGSVLNEYNNKVEAHDVIAEDIYSTENHEIFYYKFNGDGTVIYVYFLYTNGERFEMSCYNFGEDSPKNDIIFKRIVESVKFQF